MQRPVTVRLGIAKAGNHSSYCTFSRMSYVKAPNVNNNNNNNNENNKNTVYMLPMAGKPRATTIPATLLNTTIESQRTAVGVVRLFRRVNDSR